MIPARALDEIAFADGHLHLFLAGPGRGEAIAVRLPSGGWLVVDGCRVTSTSSGSVAGDAARSFPVHAILERWAEPDPVVELLVLTHPHDDHAAGIPEAIELLRPRRVAVSGAAGVDPLTELEAGASRSVVAALRAMRRARDAGAELLPLADGGTTSIGGVEVHVRAPVAAALATYATAQPEARRQVANDISAVLEIVFGATRVVLGGDLPFQRGGAVLSHGWASVMRDHAHLAEHAALKISHHGSRDALCTSLLDRPGERAWLLSPFNSSGLPRTNDEDGLDLLLGHHAPIHLTAPSVSRALIRALPSSDIDRPTLARLEGVVRGSTFEDSDTFLSLPQARGPLDAVWCVALDAGGRVTGRWKGAAAIELRR